MLTICYLRKYRYFKTIIKRILPGVTSFVLSVDTPRTNTVSWAHIYICVLFHLKMYGSVPAFLNYLFLNWFHWNPKKC